MTLIKKTFAVIMVLPPITPLAAQGNPQMFIWQNGKLAPLENADGVCFDQRPIWVFPDVQIVGDGLAREQAPAPGTLVPPGNQDHRPLPTVSAVSSLRAPVLVSI